MRVDWAAVTDPGRIRESNEDTFVVEPVAAAGETPDGTDGADEAPAAPMVFAVADGMGGHQAGEVASAIAADVVRERLADGAPNVDVVIAAVQEANAAIFRKAFSDSALHGMGTTLVALTVVPATDDRAAHFALVNVGDSRCYLFRDGELHRASVDHNYVQELIATGLITEDEARTHPRRNIITRALGIEPSVRVDGWELPIVRGDRFLLCSDGLVDEVDDGDIARLLREHDEPVNAANALLAAALANGGRDNVTIIVLDVTDGEDPGGIDGDPTPSPVTDRVPITTIQVAADPTPEGVARPARRMTLPRFVALIAAAAVVTLGVTLLAVSLTGDDDPAPATSTTTATSTTAMTATSTTSTTGTTSVTTTSRTTDTTDTTDTTGRERRTTSTTTTDPP
jgi:serine/threonine protein phosphatase PrpC